MRDTEWLASLKAGDEVYVSARYGALGEIRKVTRTTATQIIFEQENGVGRKYETRFRRKDGGSVGTDSWSHNSIHPATDELRARVRRANLLSLVKNSPWSSLSTDQLQRVFDITKEEPA